VGSVLVTGGSGFLGRHVVSRLRAGARVVSYNRDHVESADPGVVCEQGELYDIGRLVRVCERHAVDRIVHTAAMSHPEVSLEMPVATFAANVEGTLHVFEAARMAGVARIVSFSSEAVFGDHPGAVDEDTAVDPDTPYAVSKVTVELLAAVYNRHYDLDIVSLRPTELYGPGNRMPSAVHELARAVVDARPVRMPAGADHAFDLVHVDDVALAAELALRLDRRERDVFNVGAGAQTSLAEVAKLLAEIVPGSEVEVGPGPSRAATSKVRGTPRSHRGNWGTGQAGTCGAGSPTTWAGSANTRTEVRRPRSPPGARTRRRARRRARGA
jgi:nucleoside-diphosphate-sugar epimerase